MRVGFRCAQHAPLQPLVGIKYRLESSQRPLQLRATAQAKAMRQADKRGDGITSWTMGTYFPRTSVFTIWLRPAGVDPNPTSIAGSHWVSSLRSRQPSCRSVQLLRITTQSAGS